MKRATKTSGDGPTGTTAPRRPAVSQRSNAIDASPEVLTRENRLHGLFGSALQRDEPDKPALQERSAVPLQRKPWRDDARFPALLLQYLADGPIPLAAHPFNGEIYQSVAVFHGATKLDAIQQIAAVIHQLPNGATPDDFLSSRQLRRPDNIVNKDRHPFNNIPNRSKNTYRTHIDPALVKMRGTYGALNTPVNLYYMFGQESYGYIVQIEQDGADFQMDTRRGGEQLGGEQHALVARGAPFNAAEQQKLHTYASAHEATGDRSIAAILSEDAEHVPDTDDGIRARKERVDAVAKLAGEGSRWQCVAQAAGFLSDETFFFTPPTADADGAAIKLKHLWGKWGGDAGWFNFQFNVDDATVAAQLLAHRADPNVVTVHRDRANAFMSLNAQNLTTHARITQAELTTLTTSRFMRLVKRYGWAVVLSLVAIGGLATWAYRTYFA